MVFHRGPKLHVGTQLKPGSARQPGSGPQAQLGDRQKIYQFLRHLLKSSYLVAQAFYPVPAQAEACGHSNTRLIATRYHKSILSRSPVPAGNPKNARPMTQPRPNLPDAAADFRFLLARGYPRQNALTLVGNRYGLDHATRQLLHRGVFAPVVAAARRARLQLLRNVPGRPLALDGHNVLITLECAARGLPLVAADDGFIRDVGEISGAFKVSPATDRVLAQLADYLAHHPTGPVDVFYDAPLSRSGELARRTREVFASRNLTVQAAAVPVPERLLSAFTGVIATSDTALIDAHAAVVDLAGEIIRRHSSWRPISLRQPEPAVEP
jgi:hypothetical protein